MIYPDNKYKIIWELFVNLLLIVVCFLTPAQLAFSKDPEEGKEEGITSERITNLIIDIFFITDIFVSFFSATENEYNEVTDDRKKIAIEYIKGWFTIDLLSIIPFDLFTSGGQGSDVNNIVRIAKFGRLYKLIKLTKLLRLIRIIKNQKVLMNYIHYVFRVSAGIKRLIFFFLIFMVLCHIGTCLWLMTADFNSDSDDTTALLYEGTWLADYRDLSEDNGKLYCLALYWTVTTITTVGYGDISGTNQIERIFSIIIMLIGVISFSFVNGSLTSIVSSLDNSNADIREIRERFDRVSSKYNFPKQLKVRIRKDTATAQQRLECKEVGLFLNDLSYNLRHTASMFVHKDQLDSINFFKSKSHCFNESICQKFVQCIFDEYQPIYEVG